MEKSIVYKSAVLAALSALALTGCQDFDNGFEAKDIAYRTQFEKAFGKVDPNQDWSMAALVTANLNVGSGATAYVYTEKPGHKGSTLAGIITGSSAQFNLIKGTKQVYVMVEEGDQYIVSGYFNVVDNVINITDSPVSRASASTLTRSGEGSFTVGDKLFTQSAYAKKADWDGKTYIYQNHYYFLQQEGENWYVWYAANANDTFRKLAHNSDEEGNICGYASYEKIVYYADDNTEAFSTFYFPGLIEKSNGGLTFVANNVTKYITHQEWDATYYKISGDTKAEDVTWIIGDCANLFWNGDAVFHEGQNYKTEQHKVAAYAKYNTTVEELEQGVIVVTSKDNAHVDIPFMFGATLNHNIFGYYYYTNDQEALTANRYVLYEDAQPNSNIKVDGKAVGNMDLQQKQAAWTRNSVATCTNRHLVYFGPDGKGVDEAKSGVGTLDFPKGVKIGFFIMRHHDDYSGFEKSAAQRTMAETGWAYSDPNLNLKYLVDASGADNNTNWTYSNGGSNTSRGSVRAISWTYDGRLLCGFGDQSNDYDLNDFVWWVDGDVTNTTKIRITTQASSSWIVACEDLGGTFDYDFNDLVFALRKTQIKDNKTKATLELVPLAAGGTLDAKVVYKNIAKGEIHDLIKPGADVETPLNVDAGTKPAEGTPVLLEEQINWNDDINTIISDNIKVNVIQKQGEGATESNYYIKTYKKGENSVPQMMILPSGWDWPAEMVPVKDVYAGFERWVANANAATWCTDKNGTRASEYVYDPLPDVEIIETEGEEIIINPITPGADDDLKSWDIEFTESISNLTVGVEKMYTLKMSKGELDPANKDYGPNGSLYTYSVGDESIMSVKSVGYGTVTLEPKKAGRTTLSVTYDDVNSLDHKPTTKIFTFVVGEPYRDALLTANNMTIGCGKQIILVMGVNYSTQSDGEITVTSSSDLVTVNGMTLTTGSTESVQQVTITLNQNVSTDDVYGPATCQFTLTVDPNAKDPATLTVTKTATVELVAKGDAGTISKGTDFDFDLGVSNLGVTYSSSNDAVMTVSESNGVVTITPKKSGTAEVLITSASDDTFDGITLPVATINVSKAPTTTIAVGDTKELVFIDTSEDLTSCWCYQGFWVDLSSYSLPEGINTATITLTYSEADNNILFISAAKNKVTQFSGYSQSPHSETFDVSSLFSGDGFYIGFGGTGMTLSKVEITVTE